MVGGCNMLLGFEEVSETAWGVIGGHLSGSYDLSLCVCVLLLPGGEHKK